MIAVSSYKPNATGEIFRNQKSAIHSWNGAFTGIVILNGSDEFERYFAQSPVFDWKKDGEGGGAPRIRDMASICGNQPDWSCIINADIIVKRDMHRVANELKARYLNCAVSGRYEFDPDDSLVPPRVNDLGMDIFCATPEVWKYTARHMPEGFLLGHILWDAWLLGFWNTNFKGTFADFTPAKVIYHPKHGNRGDQTMDTSLQTYGLPDLHLPPIKLK